MKNGLQPGFVARSSFLDPHSSIEMPQCKELAAIGGMQPITIVRATFRDGGETLTRGPRAPGPDPQQVSLLSEAPAITQTDKWCCNGRIRPFTSNTAAP
jgi:hypothetical protein